MRLRPGDTDALFLLSQACEKAAKLPAARAALESYLGRCAGDTDARVKKGRLALRLGRLPEAAEEFSRVLEADPGRDIIRSHRAETLLRLGRFAEAVTDLDRLLKRYTKDAALFELRSQAHDGLGDKERAKADRKRAVEYSVTGARSYNDRAWALATGPAASRDPEEALASARKAVALAPGSAMYFNTLGVAQFRAALYADAIETLEKSLALSQGKYDGFNLFFLAMSRRKLGDVAGARADFNRAVRWRRDHPNLSVPQWSAELDAFQAEAEAALADPGAKWPDDVFAPPTEILGGP